MKDATEGCELLASAFTDMYHSKVHTRIKAGPTTPWFALLYVSHATAQLSMTCVDMKQSTVQKMQRSD